MTELVQAPSRGALVHASAWTRGLQLFVVSMPFLHALGPSQWLPLPMAFAMLAFVAALMSGGFAWIWVEKQDIGLLLTLLLGCIAFAFHTKYVGQKNLNHAAALFVTMTIFFFWMRAWLWRSNSTFELLGAAATIALAIASVATLVEFWLANYRGLYLADLLPYTSKDLPIPTVLGEFRRPRGLASEPGFSAMVFEALIPFSLYYLRLHKNLRYVCVPLFVAGFLVLFSAGAISAMLLALVIVLALQRRVPLRMLIAGIVVVLMLLLLLGSRTLFWVVDEVVSRKVLDLFVKGSVNLGEAAGRYDAYRAAFDMFATYPLGIGWGMVSQMYATNVLLPDLTAISSRGVLSLYLEILVSAGVLGLIIFGWFHLQKLIDVMRWEHPFRPFLMFGFISISLHHAFVLEFWFPMLWFYFAIASCIRRQVRLGSNGIARI